MGRDGVLRNGLGGGGATLFGMIVGVPFGVVSIVGVALVGVAFDPILFEGVVTLGVVFEGVVLGLAGVSFTGVTSGGGNDTKMNR